MDIIQQVLGGIALASAIGALGISLCGISFYEFFRKLVP